MAILKLSLKPVYFTMVDATTAVATAGYTVTGKIMKDGVAEVALTGTFTDKLHGVYSYTPVAADFNVGQYVLRFSASGAADRFVIGDTGDGITVNERGEVSLNTKKVVI